MKMVNIVNISQAKNQPITKHDSMLTLALNHSTTVPNTASLSLYGFRILILFVCTWQMFSLLSLFQSKVSFYPHQYSKCLQRTLPNTKSPNYKQSRSMKRMKAFNNQKCNITFLKFYLVKAVIRGLNAQDWALWSTFISCVCNFY